MTWEEIAAARGGAGRENLKRGLAGIVAEYRAGRATGAAAPRAAPVYYQCCGYGGFYGCQYYYYPYLHGYYDLGRYSYPYVKLLGTSANELGISAEIRVRKPGRRIVWRIVR